MYGQTEILLHECGHLYIRGDSDMKKTLKEACLESMSEKQLNELALKYGALWQGVMNESMTDEEFFDYALEEIYCDALAGIDRISARGASRLTEAVRGAFEEETGIDVDALLSGTETGETTVTTEKSKAENERPRNNGPPKYSNGEDVIEISDDSELERLISATKGSKYNVIREYVFDLLGGRTIKLSDGRSVIVDRNDAKEISHKANTRKTAEIANIENIIKKAKYQAEDAHVVHNKFDYFAYYFAPVKYKEETYNVILNIGRAKNDGTYHLYDLTNDKNNRRIAGRKGGLSGPVGNRITNDSSENSIRAEDEKSKQKFSMDEPIEEKRNLIALHNLNETKLLKTLKLGGFAMPSIAITKNDIPHTNFGDITVVFGKETIDPKFDKRNTVYSADAWTPLFPRIEYEAAPEVEAKIRDKYYKLAGKHGYELLKPMYSSANYVEDVLNNYGGEKDGSRRPSGERLRKKRELTLMRF